MRTQNYYGGCYMARRVYAIIMVLIIFALNGLTVVAQKIVNTIPGENLTNALQTNDSLVHYMQIALQNNPVVMQRYAEYRAALERIPQVGALPDPELTAGVFLTPMELLMGNQVADLNIMQMFPWFGVLKNAKDEMSLMAKADLEAFRNAKLEVLYDVQKTWYEMYRIQQNIRFSEKNLQILKTIEQLSLVRYRSGSTGNSSNQSGSVNSLNSSRSGSFSTSGNSGSMGSMGGQSGSSGSGGSVMNTQSQSMPQGSMSSGSGGSGLADLYRIQIEAGDLENSIELYKNLQNTVLAKFNSFLNRTALTPVSLPDTVFADSLTFDLLKIPDSIQKSNPMLTMIQLEQQSLDARKEMNKRMGLPMMGVGLNYSVINKSEMSEAEMNGRDMVMPMVKVTLPVYRKKYRAMQNETSALRSASEMNYLTTLNNLTNEYYEAVQIYMDAGRRIKLYKQQAALAERSLDVMIKSFSGASVPLSDLLRSRQQLLDYEISQIEAVTDYNTSIAWLRKLTGNMLSQ